MKKCGIGIVGVGNIAEIYIKNITTLFTELELIGVCDHHIENITGLVEKYGIKKVYREYEELIADPDVDIVLNLTKPAQHYGTTMAALKAGKHVYTEKPLAPTVREAKELLAYAAAHSLMICGAPDTFMGAGIQTCRRLISDGYIGEPIGVRAYVISHGHENWHPSPEFFYKPGAGPMLDMGPYYITCMLNLLGRADYVFGSAKANFTQRTITSKPLYGKTIDVEVPTTYHGVIGFESGAEATLTMTFDYFHDSSEGFVLFGTEGSMAVPDPNFFGGPVKLMRPGRREYLEVPLLFDYAENSRGIGLADMAKAISDRRAPRAGGEQMLHALEIMEAFDVSSREGRRVAIETPYHRSPAMVMPRIKGILD